jgi:poly-gamma-glutamate biosynthesis protein PgsC/CapC
LTIETAFLGLLVATLFVEITGIYPGGIIVPAYIALFLDQPLRILGTLAVAGLAWGTYRVLARWLILYGRRRFVLMVLLGGAWALLAWRFLPQLWPTSVELRTIGWVIPGLVANTIERQGIGLTLVAMGIASTLTYFLVRLVLLA